MMPYESPEVALQVQRAYQIGHELEGSTQSVRRDPATERWWVTVQVGDKFHVLHWTVENPVEAPIAGSPFNSQDAAFRAVEEAVA